GTALHVDGTSGYADSDLTVVDTSDSFSVAAPAVVGVPGSPGRSAGRGAYGSSRTTSPWTTLPSGRWMRTC
ncbi:hypothetical protein AB0B23_04810, partial [Streptomyces antibioticus]|uniref:hypothetical protein n=1 Tax=Streptomyces antibioticus TaxID=1890 RepID=UPI00340FA76E